MEGRFWFSNSYAEAAGRFLIACDDLREAGHSVTNERLELNMVGPDGEPLCIDVAIVGNINSNRVLMSSSGIHGVEGYPGSAIQLSIMNEMAKDDAFDNHAVIFIHAINPYGMAWWRRFNENNVDLNRNFLTKEQEYTGSPEGYHHIKDFINPQTPPKEKERWFKLKALRLIMKHGFNNLKQWVAEGQYEYPKAIQFGGNELQDGPKILLEWLDETLKNVKRIWAIDLHTGLGPSGHDTLLISAKTTESQRTHLEKLFPGHIESLDPNEGVGYEIVGDLHQGLEDRYDKLNWTSITQEFGTFKPVDVLMASRAENRWTQWGKYFDQNEAKRHWTRKNLLRTFCPNDPIWQIKITSRGKNVFNIARDDLLK
jgi:succinylglutamate desuccinylase